MINEVDEKGLIPSIIVIESGLTSVPLLRGDHCTCPPSAQDSEGAILVLPHHQERERIGLGCYC